MKVLLVAINARWTHSSLALRYLRNAIEEGWARSTETITQGEVDGNASTVTEKSLELLEYHIGQDRLLIVQEIALAKPDAILLSTYIWNAGLISAILPDLRSLLPRALLILGGPEVSHNAIAWLGRHPEINLIVSGPGETVLQNLAASNFAICRSGTGSGERLVVAEIPDFAHSPFPYRESDYPELEHRYLYYESSRGCPFSCSYCLSSRSDHALAMKPVETVCAELDLLLAHDPALVKLVDRSFNADPGRARTIWRHLIEGRADGRTRFHFEVHPALLGEEDFALLAKAPGDLFQFEIGVQTIHPATRKAIGRGGDWSAEREAISRLSGSCAIHLHLDMIVGLPGEGIEEIAATFDEIAALDPEYFQVGFLKGLPGTRMAEEGASKEMTFQAGPPYGILRSPWLSVETLAELGRIEELCDNIGNGGRFRAELAAAAVRYGGAFAAYRALALYCSKVGFDLRTRNEVKIRELLLSWLDSGGRPTPAEVNPGNRHEVRLRRR